MTNKVELISNQKQVLEQMNANIEAYQLTAGLKAVELILDQMQTGYSKPIYVTGDLQRDVDFEVDGNVINVGNSLEYAQSVHFGDIGRQAKPYITDALFSKKGREELEKLGIKTLKKGF